jgi:Holliday junction resolvase RusA-like endonuclease
MEARKAGAFPVPNAIEIVMEFRYAKPKSVKRELPTVPPDLDKQIRSILDALTGIAYHDDSQVISISASKSYGEPGVSISLISL